MAKFRGAFRRVSRMAVDDFIRSARARALSLARSEQPYVLWGNEPMNGGNFLFLWATAWSRRRWAGEEWRVRFKPKMQPWLDEFPGLRDLTVQEADVHWRQRRTVEWGQHAGRDFLLPDLRAFVREVLIPGSRFPDRWGSVTPDALVINVRRGDYYSNPHYRERYGMDVEGFVRAALRKARVDAGPVVFVSDDPAWCRKHLRHLVPWTVPQVMPEPHEIFQDLAQLSAARHLVLANSTFSYWGGYIASARGPEVRPRQVLAPLFLARGIYEYNESPLLLPEWLGVPEDEYAAGR